MKKEINITGSRFTLDGDDPKKLDSIQNFIDECLKKANEETKLNDSRRNLAYAFLSLVVDIWENIKENYSIEDGQPNILNKIEIINDKVNDKIREIENAMD